MKARYLITYDVTDDDRRTKVHDTMRGYGDWMQFSVFRCDLDAQDRAKLVAELHPLIDHREDQILLVDLGPVDGRGGRCIDAIGRKYIPAERSVIVV